MPKLRILAHGAGYAWDGTIHAWFPGLVEDVPDTREARAWADAFVAGGAAEFVGKGGSSSPAEEAASEAEPPATQKAAPVRPKVERRATK